MSHHFNQNCTIPLSYTTIPYHRDFNQTREFGHIPATYAGIMNVSYHHTTYRYLNLTLSDFIVYACRHVIPRYMCVKEPRADSSAHTVVHDRKQRQAGAVSPAVSWSARSPLRTPQSQDAHADSATLLAIAASDTYSQVTHSSQLRNSAAFTLSFEGIPAGPHDPHA